MKYSIIMLAEAWYKDTPAYLQEIYDYFSKRNDSFEIIIVANGSGKDVRNAITQLNIPDEKLKAFEFNTRNPQAVCLKAALKESKGEIIMVTESYKQIAMDSFDALLSSMGQSVDVVCPWRQSRIDNSYHQFQSKLFNSLVRFASKSRLHDLSCTVKLFRREALENTVIYGRMYRFFPILAERRGYKNIEIPCQHFQQRGQSGIRVLPSYFNAVFDLIMLYFNTWFLRKPLRFFSVIGLTSLLIGVVCLCIVFFQRVFMEVQVGGRPLLLLSILMAVAGAQIACVGLLGEIIAFTQGRTTKEYSVEIEI